MGYNITNFKIKKTSLEVSVKDIYALEKSLEWLDMEPLQYNPLTGEATIEMGCGQTIEGVLEGDLLKIKDMYMSGDGSGHIYNDVLIPLLKKSKGKLQALVTWEGGDTINKLVSVEGKVTEIDI